MATVATGTRAGGAGRAVLAELSDEDRRLYEAIPGEVDYVADRSFVRAQTEDRLFGPRAEELPEFRWRPYPELDDPGSQVAPRRQHLTPAQERTLFLRYNYARYRLAQLVRAQQRRFAARRLPEMAAWYRRVLRAQADAVSANMALVVAMARRTRINAVEFGELVSEGNMALLRAVEKFDVSRGFKFSTYACRAILKAFNRLASKVGTYRQRFPTEFQPEMERSDEIERRHGDQRDLAIEDLQRVLAMNLADLTEVERQVVGARFAVDGQRQVRTLEQVGRLVGLSKERVRQVQMGALTKLRAALEGRAA